MKSSIIALLLSLTSVMAVAQSKSPQEDAFEAYVRGDFSKALEILAANRAGAPEPELARMELLEGAIFATQYLSTFEHEKRKTAEQHFDAALRHDPFITADAYSESVRGIFNIRRWELLPGDTVQVSGLGKGRDEAHQVAEREAVRVAVQRYVTPATMNRDPMPELLQKQIISTPERFITKSRFVNTDTTGGEVQTLLLTIVNTDSIAQLATQNSIILDKSKQPTLTISIDETANGKSGGPSRIVDTYLLDYFTRLGFRVYDRQQLLRMAKVQNDPDARWQQKGFQRQLADTFGVDILVSGTATGSAHLEQVLSADVMTGEASVDVSITWIATGRSIGAAHEGKSIAAIGQGESGAAKEALRVVAEKIAPELAAKCIEDWNNAQVNGREIQFVIEHVGLNDLEPLGDQLRIVAEGHGKADTPNFEGGDHGSGSAVMYIRSRMPTQEIARRLENVVGYSLKVRSVKISQIELDVL